MRVAHKKATVGTQEMYGDMLRNTRMKLRKLRCSSDDGSPSCTVAISVLVLCILGGSGGFHNPCEPYDSYSLPSRTPPPSKYVPSCEAM